MRKDDLVSICRRRTLRSYWSAQLGTTVSIEWFGRRVGTADDDEFPFTLDARVASEPMGTRYSSIQFSNRKLETLPNVAEPVILTIETIIEKNNRDRKFASTKT